MKNYIRITVVLYLIIAFFAGCRSARNSFKNGDFDQSVIRAAEKLKENPSHSSSVEILKQAYPLAVERHLAFIKKNRASSDLFKWEPELEAYVKLNKLYTTVSRCNACVKMVDLQTFENDEKVARQNSANIRYREATALLALGDRENARKAYDYFEKVNSIIPGYKDTQNKSDLAYAIASFKVVVEQVMVTSKTYQLSNQYFQDKINEYLATNKRLNKFVQFYTPDEATNIKLRPDHIVTLQFDDFVVGETLVERNTETITSKDSVKVGEKTIGRTKYPVYAKVTAKLTQNRKIIHSAGLLDMQVRDYATKRLVNQEKFNGEYNWMCEWANFNGDERALTTEQLRKCKSQEILPPPPQELFIEFSKPIYERLVGKLQNFYANY